jgi:phosphoribosylaminoimidazolecarboxamide formyltransferase/IMP cyclohydrolase
MVTVRIRRALFSVSDKEGAVGFARFLHQRGVEILATGGTALKLTDAGVPYTPMEKITGNPEAFGGRMKTISFPFASSLLFRRDHEGDIATAKAMGVEPTDLVVCNLYPFQEARKRNASEPELVEEIDVGGPTMIRAAAKNHAHVAVATHPSQYASLMEEIEATDGGLSLETRKKLAVAAFRLLSSYDAAIADELSARFLGEETQHLALSEGKKLRYGENPHQAATFYRDAALSGETTIASAEILQGKALSYNNILDADAALRSASDALQTSGGKPVVAIVKHLNPCGLATGRSSLEALELAWAGDPVSAFGGILCFTHEVGEDVAAWLGDKFVEVIVAPAVAPAAAALFAKKKNLRVLLCPPRRPGVKETMIRSVYGGVLLQDEDEGVDQEYRSVTKLGFPDDKLALARFGVMANKHLRSNAIALVRVTEGGNFQLVGAGMGQPNRLDSIRALAGPRAKQKAGVKMEELVLISDAFFPFADGVEAAAALGVRYVVQPGGSIKDEEVIAAADRLGLAMVVTGRRHFRH